MSIKDQNGFHKKIWCVTAIITIIGLLILFQFTIAKAKGKQTIDGEACQAMVDQVIKLMPKKYPNRYEHEAVRKLFDVNSYFTVLNHLKVCDSYDLDYFYCAISRYGHPYIYTRRKGTPPYDLRTSCSIMQGFMFRNNEFDVFTKSYLQNIHADGTPESLIQFAILYLIGDQFLLFDHANYDDDIIIFSKSKLNEVLKSKLTFPKESPPPDYVIKNAEDAREKALKLDVTPVFEENEDRASVKVITFSKWGGFQQHTFTFFKKMNYSLKDKKEETLIPYNCGIMF